MTFPTFLPSSPTLRDTVRLATILAVVAGCFAASAAAQDGPLFPQPFVVEHQLVQTDPNGEIFRAPLVVDTYGGSWIVSERPDGSRLVVDLARREIAEIREERGTYWSLSFDRLAELRAEHLALDEAGVEEDLRRFDALRRQEAERLGLEKAAEPPRLVVEETTEEISVAREMAFGDASPASSLAKRRLAEAERPPILDRPGLRHLRVRVEAPVAKVGDPRLRSIAEKRPPALDAWVDPSVRLGPAARRALASLEQQTLGPLGLRAKFQPVTPAMLLHAVREHGDGAFPVRTVRTLYSRPELPEASLGTLEDVALRIEKISSFPVEKARIPQGLRRVLHPLEGMIAHLRHLQSIGALDGAPVEEQALDPSAGGPRR